MGLGPAARRAGCSPASPAWLTAYRWMWRVMSLVVARADAGCSTWAARGDHYGLREGRRDPSLLDQSGPPRGRPREDASLPGADPAHSTSHSATRLLIDARGETLVMPRRRTHRPAPRPPLFYGWWMVWLGG